MDDLRQDGATSSNLLEIATDAFDLASFRRLVAYERLAIAAFDARYRFDSSRSRFQQLCGGWPKSKTRVALGDGFTGVGAPGEVDLWYCEVTGPHPDPLGGRPLTWLVAGFTDRPAQDLDCEGAVCPTADQAMEVTYMMTADDSVFPRQTHAQLLSQAQRRLSEMLRKTSPY